MSDHTRNSIDVFSAGEVIDTQHVVWEEHIIQLSGVRGDDRAAAMAKDICQNILSLSLYLSARYADMMKETENR